MSCEATEKRLQKLQRIGKGVAAPFNFDRFNQAVDQRSAYAMQWVIRNDLRRYGPQFIAWKSSCGRCCYKALLDLIGAETDGTNALQPAVSLVRRSPRPATVGLPRSKDVLHSTILFRGNSHVRLLRTIRTNLVSVGSDAAS